MAERSKIIQYRNIGLAAIIWGIAFCWGYYYENTVPINWIDNTGDILWNLVSLFPGENANKIAVNQSVSHWLVSRVFFVFYFICNYILFKLVVQNKKATKTFLLILAITYTLHSLLDTFGLLTLKDLSWSTYWIYKIFTFSINPFLSLFAIVFYRVSKRLSMMEN